MNTAIVFCSVSIHWILREIITLSVKAKDRSGGYANGLASKIDDLESKLIEIFGDKKRLEVFVQK